MTYLQRFPSNTHKKNWICSCGRKNGNEDRLCFVCKRPPSEKMFTCLECGVEFANRSHTANKKFCSKKCSTINQWKTRPRAKRKIEYKSCTQCGKEFLRNKNLKDKQWCNTKYCSHSCSAAAKKINDGLTTYERCAIRKGTVKQGTKEWKDKISKGTKAAMYRPEVNEKIRKPKGAWSDDRKHIQSSKLVGIMPKNLVGAGSFPNVQKGDYECSKGSVFFRSKWEANYALYLDFLIKNGDINNWEFENKVFVFEPIKFGTRSYRPDFEVTMPDGSIEYHEVKGYMDGRSKTKLKRMEKYFPDVKLILIQRDRYMGILKSLKGVIRFY
jgi:hypothetical protein